MFRRSLLILPAALVAIALPAAPALAGEGDEGDDSAQVRVKQRCVNDAKRAKVMVIGEDIESVTFIVDGNEVVELDEPNAGTAYRLTMNCFKLGPGSHRGRAVVSSDDEDTTLRFRLEGFRAGSPRFAG